MGKILNNWPPKIDSQYTDGVIVVTICATWPNGVVCDGERIFTREYFESNFNRLIDDQDYS